MKDLAGLARNELRVLRGLARGEKLGEVRVPNKYRAAQEQRLVEKINEEYRIVDLDLSSYLRKMEGGRIGN